MNKIDLLIGFVIGIAVSILGSFIFITFFTEFDYIEGLKIMKSQGHLGKVITLGTIADLIVFGILLQLNKELMARGVVLAVICIAIITLFA